MFEFLEEVFRSNESTKSIPVEMVDKEEVEKLKEIFKDALGKYDVKEAMYISCAVYTAMIAETLGDVGIEKPNVLASFVTMIDLEEFGDVLDAVSVATWSNIEKVHDGTVEVLKRSEGYKRVNIAYTAFKFMQALSKKI